MCRIRAILGSFCLLKACRSPERFTVLRKLGRWLERRKGPRKSLDDLCCYTVAADVGVKGVPQKGQRF